MVPFLMGLHCLLKRLLSILADMRYKGQMGLFLLVLNLMSLMPKNIW